MTRIEFKFKIPYGAFRDVHFQIATRLSLKKNKRNAKPYKKKQPVKIQLKGLTILPKKKLAILRTEKETEIKRSKTETQNIRHQLR